MSSTFCSRRPTAAWTLLALAALVGSPTAAVASADSATRGTACGTAVLLGQFELESSVPGQVIYSRNPGVDLGIGGPLPDAVLLEFYGSGVGATGTFNLGQGPNGNYSTCVQCLLVLQDRDPVTSVPAKVFFASAGSLVIDPSTPPGGANLQVDLVGARVVEVTIDPNTFVSTPVVGGDCYDHVAEVIFANGFE